MTTLIDLWQRLGILLLSAVCKTFKLDNAVTGLWQEMNQLKEEKAQLSSKLQQEKEEKAQLVRQINFQQANLQAITEDFEQSALNYLRFRQLMIKCVRAYEHLLQRRAAVSRVMEILIDCLQITNEEIRQQDQSEHPAQPMAQLIRDLRNFLGKFSSRDLDPETSS